MNAALQPMGLVVPEFEPEHVVCFDFETFWEQSYTLKKLSTSDYVMDPRFEVLGCGVKIDGGETLWMEEPEFRLWAASWPWSKTALLAQHAHFDGLICSMHYGFAPGFWLDTLSMARALGLPGSLEKLAEHFKVGVKGNETLNAKGKRRKDFTEEEWAAYGLYCIQDVDLAWAIYLKTSENFPEPELHLIDSTVRMFTEPQLVIDEPMLRQYMEEERIRKAALLERVGLTKKEVGSSEKLAAVFREMGIEPPTKLSPTSKKRNPDGSRITVYAFAKTDAGMQELLEHPDDDVRWLAEARVAVKSTQTETRGERFLRMGVGGRPLPVYLKHCGAHTFRWTASDKTQFQNLQKTSKKDPKRGMLKKSLCAIPGRKVVAADSGAIEARGTSWLAGHEVLTASFRENRDVYSDFASSVYGRKIDRKKNLEDEVPGFLGKVAVLGLGYGMGWQKFATTLLAGAMAPPIKLLEADAVTMEVDLDKFFADEKKIKRVKKIISRLPLEELVVHCAVAEKIVQKYRKVNKPIKELWKTMEAVLDVMNEVGDTEQVTFGPNDCLTIIRHGIICPNGLVLRYPSLHKSERKTEIDEDGEEVEAWGSHYTYLVRLGKNGKKRVHTYGGALTENVIQALARIIVGEQVLSVKAKYGYEPVLLTHDEIGTIVDDAEAPLAEYRLIEEMKITPAWAKGWPLSAEGGHAQSYGLA